MVPRPSLRVISIAGLGGGVLGCVGQPGPPPSAAGSSDGGDTSGAPVGTSIDHDDDLPGTTDGLDGDSTGLATTKGMETSTSSTGTDTGDSGTSESGTVGGCTVWEITYSLDGSQHEISNTPFMVGDQLNTVAEPYDADDTVGPGSFVLRFQDVDGAPGGAVAMVSYQMSMHYVISSEFTTTVTTDLENEAGPQACGLTTGTLVGDTLSFAPAAIVGHHSMGQMLCDGLLCGAVNLPNGMPVAVDETTDQPLSDFVFSADRSSFTMDTTVVEMTPDWTTSWSYLGTEIGRELIDAPPCLCG